MTKKKWRRVMLDFIGYKYDVLVATTIIENGIDIPRANTIIINRADNYGLSQLYQLRGRVGRSSRRAYAYLLIPAEQELSPIARRRLAAIREFSDLGAGFRIAALDLELRGAGNMLGGEQSGHMDALGFDLYTQMLERTVAELQGEQVEDEPTVSLNLGVDVAIPESYIADMANGCGLTNECRRHATRKRWPRFAPKPKIVTDAFPSRSKTCLVTHVCDRRLRLSACCRSIGPGRNCH